jgi:hypothetical protein
MASPNVPQQKRFTNAGFEPATFIILSQGYAMTYRSRSLMNSHHRYNLVWQPKSRHKVLIGGSRLRVLRSFDRRTT